MKVEPPQNPDNRSAKTESPSTFVDASPPTGGPGDNGPGWKRPAAWGLLLSVVLAVILLALILKQEKPADINSRRRDKDRIAREKYFRKPAGKGAGGEKKVIIDTNSPKYDFPPGNLTLEPINPGGIYENRLAVSEEPLNDNAPLIKFMPIRLNLSPSKPSGRFWLRNDGNPDLTFHLTPDNKQITVSPASGRLRTDQTIYITVTASAGGKVIINSNGGYDMVKIRYTP